MCVRTRIFFFFITDGDHPSFWISYEIFDMITYVPFCPCLTCRFLYDGSRINDDDTPASLDMEDNGASKGSLFHVRSSTYHVLPQYPPPHNRHY